MTFLRRLLPDSSASVRTAFCFGVGVVASLLGALLGAGELTPVIGWDSVALLYVVWAWMTIWHLDASETERRARREDPGRVAADALLLGAALVSLAAVALLLVRAGNSAATTEDVFAGLGIVSVAVGWGVVHTVFTVRYARLYYADPRGGVDFNEQDPPRYTDFAYLAFTVGMTFQVSDTDLETKEVRSNVLRHALMSYVFGAVIIATTINLVADLTK
jgi:uncharacterized membrane protein